jgi:hypothetical protein
LEEKIWGFSSTNDEEEPELSGDIQEPKVTGLDRSRTTTTGTEELFLAGLFSIPTPPAGREHPQTMSALRNPIPGTSGRQIRLGKERPRTTIREGTKWIRASYLIPAEIPKKFKVMFYNEGEAEDVCEERLSMTVGDLE